MAPLGVLCSQYFRFWVLIVCWLYDWTEKRGKGTNMYENKLPSLGAVHLCVSADGEQDLTVFGLFWLGFLEDMRGLLIPYENKSSLLFLLSVWLICSPSLVYARFPVAAH